MSECRRSHESFETEEEGKINRKILNGYWIWWCYEHNQPIAWCVENNLKQQRKDLLSLLKDMQHEDQEDTTEKGVVLDLYFERKVAALIASAGKQA